MPIAVVETMNLPLIFVWWTCHGFMVSTAPKGSSTPIYADAAALKQIFLLFSKVDAVSSELGLQ